MLTRKICCILVAKYYQYKTAKYFANTRVFTWLWTDNFINSLDKYSLILDIGSGNGRNTKYSNHAIFGLDISLEQLKMGNNESNVSNASIQANANTLVRNEESVITPNSMVS